MNVPLVPGQLKRMERLRHRVQARPGLLGRSHVLRRHKQELEAALLPPGSERLELLHHVQLLLS